MDRVMLVGCGGVGSGDGGGAGSVVVLMGGPVRPCGDTWWRSNFRTRCWRG